VKLGDYMNGYKAIDTFYSVSEAFQFLVTEAIENFPGSDFSEKYTRIDLGQ